jgi:hypothetical protein
MPSLHGRRPGLARATATLMLRTVDDLRRIVRTFAFVQPKTKSSGQGITHATLRNLLENPGAVPDSVIRQIIDRARQYRFFHWHLEFPGIFTVPDDGTADPNTGWTGGFSCRRQHTLGTRQARAARRHRRRHRALRLRGRRQRSGDRNYQGRIVAGGLRPRPAVPVPRRALPRRQHPARNHTRPAARQHSRHRIRGPRRRRQGMDQETLGPQLIRTDR